MEATRLKSDYFIEKRRTQESSLKNLYNFIKNDNNVLQKAQWENKTIQIMEKSNNKRKYDHFLDQRRRFLDFRRQKLSELLQKEESDYKRELIDKQETPDQVRKKMEEKLNALKEQREKERQETVKSLLDKKFYEGADELRKNDSEAFAVSCYLTHENQMLEKLRKREQELKEEEMYVKLYNYDLLKKDEKERMIQEEKRRLKEDTYKFLDWQKEHREKLNIKDKELKEYEAARLREQWERDLISEKSEKEIVKEVNLKVYKDIDIFNKREQTDKHKKTEYEKMKDKELINRIIEKEKALDEIDKKEKEKQKLEFSQNKKYLEYIMNQKKEAEAWMDKLAQIEADKQFYKNQEQWMKEEAARIELLKKVYKEREEAIKLRKFSHETERKAIDDERRKLDDEIRKYNEAVEKIKREEAAKRKKHQDDLIYQISEKENQKKKEINDKYYDEREAKIREIEYAKKIAEQRELHKKRLEELKRSGITF